MTYGVVPTTMRRYRELLPELKPDEEAKILAWMLEAREMAMVAGTSEEKHRCFRNAKGKINNFLSAAGYVLP